MGELVWDAVGERRYETGIDRGVLYIPGGAVVPWNGLVSVSEERAREVQSFYQDGIKFLQQQLAVPYSAKLRAFTYPDELDGLLGTADAHPGVTLHEQNSRSFHISYRTRVANDVDGIDHGYKIHIIYNVMASPSAFEHETVGEQASAEPFEWDLSGLPVRGIEGFRPTSHISFDSRHIDGWRLGLLENQIYGDGATDPSLPTLPELLTMLA